MENFLRDFANVGRHSFLFSRKRNAELEHKTYIRRMRFDGQRIGVIGINDFGLKILKLWKQKYRRSFWLIGYDNNTMKAKSLWAQSNLMSDFGEDIPRFIDKVKSPYCNDKGDDRKQSGIFIICADTDEEYDNYLKELRNPIDLDYTGIEETTPFGLQPGDIVINCLGKKIVLIQNDDLDIVYSFDFLNFITNS